MLSWIHLSTNHDSAGTDRDFWNTSGFKLQGIVCRQYLLKLLVTVYYLHIVLDDFNVGRRVKQFPGSGVDHYSPKM
jgi:hypothetical protein